MRRSRVIFSRAPFLHQHRLEDDVQVGSSSNVQRSDMAKLPRFVYVVGAGASKEANLPLGAELKQEIAQALDIRFEHGFRLIAGSERIVSSIQLLAHDINPYLHAGRHIRDAMPQALSIDNFVDAHSGNGHIETMAKLAIVGTIVERESRSLICSRDPRDPESPIDLSKLESSWYNSLFQLITENCRVDAAAARMSEVAFVVFNYDRCIEQFMFKALQNYYRIPMKHAADIWGHVEIHHVYGSVGHLPWQNPDGSVGFGEQIDGRRLLNASKQIKTFTEGTDPSDSTITRIQELMTQAENIVFLGLAYGRQNLQLLFQTSPRSGPLREARAFGTAIGISNSDVKHIRASIAAGMRVTFEDVELQQAKTCSALFQEYWRSLSLS
jgi:hypothetical protein